MLNPFVQSQSPDTLTLVRTNLRAQLPGWTFSISETLPLQPQLDIELNVYPKSKLIFLRLMPTHDPRYGKAVCDFFANEILKGKFS